MIKEAGKLGLVAQAEKFRPNDPLTRAEAVALCMRLRDIVKREAAEMVRQAIEDIRKAG